MVLCTLPLSAQIKTQVIDVSGSCMMCKDRIEEVAQGKGVSKAEWDINTQLLTVSFDISQTHSDTIQKRIAESGHDTQDWLAPAPVYDALPGCCQYRVEGREHEPENRNILSGIVSEINDNGETVALEAAQVHWLGTTVGTFTNEYGVFFLPMVENHNQLIISYITYDNDTLMVEGSAEVNIIMSNVKELETVEITYRQKSTSISTLDPIKTEFISGAELTKAACCNLAESFETNPSVDVSFTDAVTGTRQIQLLGLAGPYTQIMRESMPNIRGISAIYGLTYVPGPWVSSIQLNKGTGSVVNGFESIAGQINVELKKPENSEKFFLNLYTNQMGRMEANINFSNKISKKWSSATLLHAKYLPFKHDRNKDGFLDVPTGQNLIGVHRWKFFGNNGLEGQFGVKGTYIHNVGGQLNFDPTENNPRIWGMNHKTRRVEGWFKMGKVFPKRPYSSIGFQLSGTSHNQKSKFGQKQYNAIQNSAYANLIYQSVFKNTNHKYRTGISFQWDQFDEQLSTTRHQRNEAVPGTFFEYTYTYLTKFSAVAGLRADYHNIYGPFVTPRLHLRYAIKDRSILRASAGRGQRTASILAENNAIFASSRQIVILSENSDYPYGLNPEVAWNFGLNFTQHFDINEREATFTVDLYHTRFQNQIVVDYEQSPQEIHFYNLKGQSYSNSIQAQFDYELFPRFDIRIAYRLFDVKTTYTDELLEKPLIARHRAFTNLAYETKNQWKFDFTLNWQGRKRIPSTESNPIEYQLDSYSPNFFLMNAQISKTWKDKFDVYVGAENLANYRQDAPILASEQPYSPYFDSSLVWGPIFGRNIYAGIRFAINRPKCE